MPPRNRMLTGYVFNVTFTYPSVEVKPQLDQKIVYAKSLEIAEKYVDKMYPNKEHLDIVYEGFFFQ
jgi:hypothetical protein